MVVILDMFKAAPPELVRVSVCAALVAPTGSEANVKLVAESVTLGSRTPLPVNGTLWGEFGALSAMLMDARRAPAAVGVKVTLREQPAPTAKVAMQVLLVMAKSPALVPAREVLVIVNEAWPVFVTTRESAALVVLTGASGNARLVGERVTAGAAKPLPAKATVCGLLAALSLIVSVP